MRKTKDLLLGILENELDTELGAGNVAVKKAETISALLKLLV